MIKNNLLTKILIVLGLAFSVSTFVSADRTANGVPGDGVIGRVLVSLGGGDSVWTATSSLGITSTVYTGTYPIIVTGSVISSGFSTSTINVFSAKQTFTNASSTSFTGDTLYSTTGIFGSGTFSSTLGVTGKTTLANASTTGGLTVAGNAYFPGSGIWNTSGNVGVGTTSPQALLDIENGTTGGQMALFSQGSQSAHIGFASAVTTPRAMFGYNSATGNAVVQGSNQGSAKGIEFNVGNSTFGGGTVAVISPVGNIGVSSSTPSNKLTIATGSILVSENVLSTSTSMTVSWLNGNTQLIRNGVATTTITFSNVIAGQTLKIIACNPPSGTPGSILFSTTTFPVYWVGGTTPTQTTTVNKCDVYSFIGTSATSSTATSPQVFGAVNQNF